ncbi:MULTISPECIES: translesion error-prone DNA polymerase V autoproteolytic subunit [unclassified Bifidobacterium]|uniref:LexA family protein n=1 Tax=unclassified Bifidobacterium TaxID=2608897 RepID=UPI0023F8D580|nr:MULTISPECIES: translesion error-prone DNA polymerase V autoproteolytic subunit [unclassified Bifidobacterium]WEV65197.1 translesion error-prone DNA polymerase V autoproteolytic subunit [Bifidobacterium sp. ESL0764]WEV75990.1 translesion error-prone DNA polymerase V autoproteolytic subunit [Bifidobacterium sp. ESL0800]
MTTTSCRLTCGDPGQDCRVTRVFRSTLAPTPIPIALEAVHAGFPSVAQDYFAGDFSFDEHIIRNPDTTYIITVAGDSMEGAGIWDGDLLVVDRSLEPQVDDVVVAVLDGELTVKRLLMRGSTPILHPENPRYPDFSPQNAEELVIWGVVTGNFHIQSRSSRFGSALPGITRPGMSNASAYHSGATEKANGTTGLASRSPGWSGGATIYPFPQRGN